MPQLPYIKHSDKEEFSDVALSELLHECPEGFGFFVYETAEVHTAFIYPAGESKVRFITVNNNTKEQVAVIIPNTTTFGEVDEEARELVSRWEEDS